MCDIWIELSCVFVFVTAEATWSFSIICPQKMFVIQLTPRLFLKKIFTVQILVPNY